MEHTDDIGDTLSAAEIAELRSLPSYEGSEDAMVCKHAPRMTTFVWYESDGSRTWEFVANVQHFTEQDLEAALLGIPMDGVLIIDAQS